MTPLRILIVDDEPLARERVRAMLRGEPLADVIGECGNGPDAVKAIERERPDLVLLDMQMPGCDGLQVVKQLPAEQRPLVIYVTAHEQFAVEAFGVEAVDYLLKPFERERLLAAIKRAATYGQARRAQAADSGAGAPAGGAPTPARPPRLSFKTDGRLVFLRPDEITWVEAADNYAVLHLAGGAGRLMVRETLSSLAERLGSPQFARINRSAIARVDEIKALEPTVHGDYTVVLRSGARLPLSRSQRGQLGKFAADAL